MKMKYFVTNLIALALAATPLLAADSKITDLTELVTVDAAADWVPIVDVSDTTQAASGTTKKIKPENLGGGSGGSVYVDGAQVTNPNFTTNAAITREVTASTNVVTDLNDAFVSLTDAATIAVDCSQGLNFKVTLGGDRTLGAPSNGKAGRGYLFKIKQDGTGNRLLTLATNFMGATATPADFTLPANRVISLSTNANSYTYLKFICREDDATLFDYVGIGRGFE